VQAKVNPNTWWTPQIGPQLMACLCPAHELFFGGSRGGGKTDLGIGRQVRGALQWGDAWNGLIVRRKYKDLAELRRRWDELIRKGLPARRIGGPTQTNYIRFDNGAVVELTAIMHSAELDDFVGRQFTELLVEEGTKFPFFGTLIDKLRGSIRSAHGVPCKIVVTGNPGGSGHSQVRSRYVEPDGTRVDDGVPYVDAHGTSRVFIRSELSDNRILCENDPEYVKALQSIDDPALRAAWLYGDWDATLDQAFCFRARWPWVVPTWPVPEWAQVLTTFDWGSGAPFSWGWWWVDSEGRLYRFAEWYGWSGKPNEGLHLADSEIASGVLEREAAMPFLKGRSIQRFCGHDCFARRPDVRQGGWGPSTAETFARLGLVMTRADNDRRQKIAQMRERFRVRKNPDGEITELPMMVVYESCRQFLRTIPDLSLDEDNAEDVDTDCEDHIYDEAAQAAMARPLALSWAPQVQQVLPPSAGLVGGGARRGGLFDDA